MPSRSDVEKAVRWSKMPPTPRLIVYALLTKADNNTAVIPNEHAPALSTIVEMTGLARSAVTEWLPALEDSGWLKRTLTPAGRNTYTLLSGSPEVAPRPRKRASAQRTSPPGGHEGVRQADSASPLSGHASPEQLSQPLSRSSRRRSDEAPPRDDVERICTHLADRIEGNGSKRPSITKAWRTAARLMLDKDGIPEGYVIGAINWCQDDEFWRSNILSMPKLREKYDQMRLQAERRRGNRPAKDDQLAEIVVRADRLQAQADRKELTS